MRSAHTLACLALPLIAAGCVINVDSHTERSGRYVGRETLDQIQPGARQDYVLALLGEPTSRSALAGGIEIWKWAYRVKKTSKGAVLFVFSSDNSTASEGSTYVEFRDGAVAKTWQD